MTNYAIGFSNFYYTLWTYVTEPQYIVDNYGSRWLVGYTIAFQYHKNISMELEKAKLAYPNVEFREDLRGITGFPWRKKNEDDFCPHIMKFGKYHGHNIDDLMESHFDYVIWVCENRGGTSNGIYAREHETVISHYQMLKKNKDNEHSHQNMVYDKLIQSGVFEIIPERNLRISDYGAYLSTNIDELNVLFHFPPGTFKEMDYQGFTYGLPLVDGKAKRIKSKPIRLSFERNDDREYGFVVNVNKVELV